METCSRCGGPLIEGEPCAFCAELAEREGLDATTVERMDAMSRAGFAELRERRAEMTEEQVAAEQHEFERRRWELPATVRPLQSHLELGCAFSQTARCSGGVFCFDPASRIQVFGRPWTHVVGLHAKGPETPERRVTGRRLLESYVVVETIGNDRYHFQVSVDLFELRARLAHRQAWLQRHSRALRAT